MDRKDVGFRIFGVAAVVEIVALLAAEQGYGSMTLLYVIAAAALVALASLGLYTFEAWRHPTSSQRTTRPARYSG